MDNGALRDDMVLNDGNRMPRLGLGVWEVASNQVADVVAEAVNQGYRLIDTAKIYGNEEGVGDGLARAGAPRETLFVTTKLWNDRHGYDLAQRELDASLRRLRLAVLDLYLIHWPVVQAGLYRDAWRGLVAAQKAGKVKSIGVSNFAPPQLAELIEDTGVVPAVNQIKLHPYNQQRAVREVHARLGIAIEAYSPLGRGAVLNDPVIVGLAGKYKKIPAQIVLRWILEQDLIVIPKTVHADRLRANRDVFDFALDGDDRAAIDALDRQTV